MTSRERGEAMAAILKDETKERHSHLCWPGTAYVAAAIALAVDAAVAAERERCARIVEESLPVTGCQQCDPSGYHTETDRRTLAAAIRTPGAA